MSHTRSVSSTSAAMEYYNQGRSETLNRKEYTMADIKTNTCPVKNTCGFCYKNLWHWYVLVATLPFFVKGVKFVANFLQSVTNPVAQ
jgi:hypothetical protein